MAKRCRGWCFTWNNYDENSVAQLTQKVFPNCKCYAVQEEIGANGTPHLQGYLYFNNARTFECVRTTYLLGLSHVEPAKNKTKALAYCQKEDSRLPDGRRWVNIPARPSDNCSRRVKDPLDGKDLYGWQQEILVLISQEPDERTIHWYWEPVGCSGKTSLAVHICMQDPTAIYICGKAADMKYAIAECKIKPRVCIMDFVRSQENYISYQGIEEIKNGIFFSGKYKGGMVMFDQPHLIVFANCPPNTSKMSRDRWDIHMIEDQNTNGIGQFVGGVPQPEASVPRPPPNPTIPSEPALCDQPDNVKAEELSLEELYASL